MQMLKTSFLKVLLTYRCLGLNAMVKSLPPLAGRLVPFAAVAAANCINIPLMRRSELQQVVFFMDKTVYFRILFGYGYCYGYL